MPFASLLVTRVKPQIRFLLKKPQCNGGADDLLFLGWQIPHARRALSEKTSPGNGVKGLPRLLRPFPAFSARVTRAQDPFFAPETIARRRPVPPPPLWMNDTPHAMRASREEAARRGTRDGQGAYPLPAAPFSIPAQKTIAPPSCPGTVRMAARDTRDGGRCPIFPPPTLFMGGRANGR